MVNSHSFWPIAGIVAAGLVTLGLPSASVHFAPAAHAAETQPPVAYLDHLNDKAELLLEGDNRDPVAAAQLLREAVFAGSVPAMLMLAELYAAGDGVPADFDEARKLIEGAIDAGGGTSAMVALGDLYRSATAPNKDPGAAVAAYREAADDGHTGGMMRLAEMLAAGEGVPVDFDGAERALMAAIAADKDAAETAWRRLGDLYRNATPDRRDPGKAIAAYEHARELGNTGVLVTLGRMVGEGDGTTADFERARGYLEEAVALGDDNTAWAQATLGDLYRNAALPHRDPAKAIESYEAALAGGNTDVLVVLARMVGRGDGVEASFERAKGYLDQAIALEDDNTARAYATLGDLYRADGEHRDPALAVEAYQNAVDRGSVDQLVTLARMVGRGEGVTTPDFERARSLLERAVVEDEDDRAAAFVALGDLYRDAQPAHRDMAKAVAAYRQASELNDGSAMLRLARILGRGDGVPVDIPGAREQLERAIALKDNNAQWAYALLGDFYRAPQGLPSEPAKAVAAYRKALELGNTDVLIVLARMIGAGEGVPAPEFDLARTHLERAISLGGDDSASAWASLGDLYRNAAGARRDPAKAVAAYEQARALGNTDVLVPLARLYGAGDGVARDFQIARSYLDEAIAVGGERLAGTYLVLGDLYRDAEDANRDLAEAAVAYQNAAELGDTDAMLRLARMVAAGDGVPADFSRARALLETIVVAADDNQVEALVRLGDLYRDGEGASNDPEAAMEAYRRAADLGDTSAMIRMARMIGSGDGVPASFEDAQAIYEQAIAAGDANAAMAWTGLADLYRSAEAANRDPAKAVAAYEKAIELGNGNALIVLAEMVAAGEGTSADPAKAKALLERAGTLGGEAAIDAWNALAALHRDQTGSYYDIALAHDYYMRAAEAGSGSAHLAAAEIETSLGIASAEQRQALVRHYQEAARLIGAEQVVRAMYKLDPPTLYATVQEMLSQADRPISADGIFGKQMQAAIDRFCTANGIDPCGKGLVSFELLIGLVSHPPAPRA